jgi:hypothetical protein
MRNIILRTGVGSFFLDPKRAATRSESCVDGAEQDIALVVVVSCNNY